MGNVLVKDKEIAVPGDTLAEGMDFLPGFGTYRLNEAIMAQRLGLVSVEGRAVKIIPLSGSYMPKKNDVVIGRVIDVTFSGWRLEINSAYTAMLMMKDGSSEYIARGADLTHYYQLGNHLVCKITNVTSQKLVDLTMKGPGLKKLRGGRTIMVSPYKVPRVIGKQGSMVTLVKQATNCRIVVGQNGVIWIDGAPEDEVLAVETIRKIEREAHMQGLTERIGQFLQQKKGGAQ